MTDLIGLLHRERNLDKVIDFVNKKYGPPESLMLELPSDWRKNTENIGDKDTFFYVLAKEYESRGSQIIAGDLNRIVHSPPLSKKATEIEKKIRNKDFEYETNFDGFKDLAILMSEIIRYKTIKNYNLLSSKKGEIRNSGFLTALNSSDPEVIIIGDHHAQYLKIHRPELKYTYLHHNTLFDNWAFHSNSFFFKTIEPDFIHFNN